MSPDRKNNSGKPEEGRLPGAGTGNASNPNPRNTENEPDSNNQLLDKKAEKYLRESANIEDVPDPQDQQDAEEIIKREQNE